MDILNAKEQLRLHIRQKRSELSQEQQSRFSRNVAEHFVANIPLLKGDVVAGFWPMHSEVDVKWILEILEEQGVQLCLPCVEQKGKPLKFRRYMRGDVLIPHPTFLVHEPDKQKDVMLPNVVMVPLLAFDATGGRLGYGGGFYDRTLAQLEIDNSVNKRLLTVGVAYSFQQVAKVPADIHDERLDAVVTEKGVMVFEE